STTPRRRASSPRGRCPRPARSGTGPSAATARGRAAPPAGGHVLRSRVEDPIAAEYDLTGALVTCPSCQTENRSGARFCRGCGGALAARCPACAAPVEPGQRFCDECGESLEAPRAVPAERPEPVAERRLVSLLFADLVGFTALSES